MPISFPASTPSATTSVNLAAISTGPPSTVEAQQTSNLLATYMVNGVPTDPIYLTLTVTSPSGVATVVTYAGGQIQRSAAGQYFYAWTGTLIGRHIISWQGPGAEATTDLYQIASA